MPLASLQRDHHRLLYAVPKTREHEQVQERVSDAWPDWSAELGETELTKAAEKNRPSLVLREAAAAVVYSVGLVILLMAVLTVLHIR